MKSFEESIAWQRAMDLNEAVDIAFSENRNWDFRVQLFRASLSICNNIAEGHEMPTKAHQLRYLWTAKGSCIEVCSMLHLARRRKYFPPEQIDRMMALQDQTARLLRTYIKTKTTGWRDLPGAMALLGLWFNLTTPYFLR